MKNKKTGFFFLNHSHQIYHAASIAFELSKYPNQEVMIFCSTKINYDVVTSLAERYLGENYAQINNRLTIELILPSLFYRLTRFFKKRPFPGYKAIFSNNKIIIQGCNTLVSSSDDVLQLKNKSEFSKKMFVYTRHGAGDREYGFSKWIYKFDKVFVSSEEVKSRFLSFKQGDEDRFDIIGYPKFDICIPSAKKINYFNNSNPVILYNPHFENEYSSWFCWGESIIKYFSENKELNLLIAPHISFSERETKKMKRHCVGKENIYIDTERQSSNLVDMTYTLNSDVYLGDVSSQVYEFLVQPKPCLFLNPNKFEWENNPSFQCWNYGDVVERFDDFEKKLASVNAKHSQYKEIQEVAFKTRFFSTVEIASRIAANLLSE